MKVSALVPTRNRAHLHPLLHRIFSAQTHEDRELVILDDSDEPSAYFASCDDPKVKYHHLQERMTVGAKRNWLAEHAEGEVLAHFDDDDYYAPTYLTRMLGHLEGYDMVKLVGFFAYSQTHDAFCYWDLASVHAYHFKLESDAPVAMMNFAETSKDDRERWMAKNLFGYGFSFVYKKSVFDKVKFDDVAHGEDAKFTLDVDEAGFQVHLVHDAECIATVVRHSGDHSIIFPQYMLPPFLLRGYLGDDAFASLLEGIELNSGSGELPTTTDQA